MICTFQSIYTDNSPSSEESSVVHEKTPSSLARVRRRDPSKKTSPSSGDFNLLRMHVRPGDVSVPHQLSHAH